MDERFEFQTQLSKTHLRREKTYKIDYLQINILTGQSPSGKFGGSVMVNLKTPPL